MALGDSQRFSGYGCNRELAFDSIAQGLFLLISQCFITFLYIWIQMKIPGGAWAPSGVLEGRDFQAMDFRPWI